MTENNIPIKGTISYKIGAFSQFANAWIGSGNRDQTFSARTYEGRVLGIWWCIWAEKVVNILFFWTKDHAKVSYFTDNEFTYKKD